MRSSETAVDYRHVDVFAGSAYEGNGLIVAFCETLQRPAEQLRRIAAEMRQFETIFVTCDQPAEVTARVFTVEEELPFAGHPVLGAAAAVHERVASGQPRLEWRFTLGERKVLVISERDDVYYSAKMDQGLATLADPLSDRVRDDAVGWLGLEAADLLPVPIQVVSTGLPYLIVPVTPSGLARARIQGAGFDAFLARVGAKFVYVLDPLAPEGRTWDNAGIVEDVATGSAAGPAAAYLAHHGLASEPERLELAQGRFVGRPSIINVTRDAAGHLWVGGPVRPVGSGRLEILPTSSGSVVG